MPFLIVSALLITMIAGYERLGNAPGEVMVDALMENVVCG